MSIDKIIIYLMVVFAVLGALDRIIGNRFGIGEKFEEGIMAIGSLAVSMVGIIALAPVIAKLLKPVVVPVFNFLGADPAMFAGTILANDMGGATLAQELAYTTDAGLFGGLIVGSMMCYNSVYYSGGTRYNIRFRPQISCNRRTCRCYYNSHRLFCSGACGGFSCYDGCKKPYSHSDYSNFNCTWTMEV